MRNVQGDNHRKVYNAIEDDDVVQPVNRDMRPNNFMNDVTRRTNLLEEAKDELKDFPAMGLGQSQAPFESRRRSHSQD